jgi:glycosyltransferase involved in cell wall biosynthesis
MDRLKKFVSGKVSGLRRRWVIRRLSSLRRSSAGAAYNPNPRVSAIVQVFNRRSTIEVLIRRLQSLPIDELIVIDDGSLDGTNRKAMSLLTRKNDFLLRANDLFEVRTYDRALSMARGRYAILLQDDDLPPAEPQWVAQAVALFEGDPKLLILGGRTAATLLVPDPVAAGEDPAYQVHGKIGGRPGVNKAENVDAPALRRDGIPFQYAMTICRAPMWVRRADFLSEIGIDQAFAPYMCDDSDGCLRAWRKGWRVGLYRAGFRNLDEGGMRLFNAARTRDQVKRNYRILYERHMDLIQDGSLAREIAELNRTLEAHP